MKPLPNRELPLLMVGVDHRCAELDLRERVAYDEDESANLLARLSSKEEIDEALLLSTCNRIEIYLRPQDEDNAFKLALDLVFLAKAPEIKDEGRFYVKHRDQAARHLMAVAAGLESMVLGEPEILGQVKRAARLADALGSAGAVLRRLSRSALSAGRRVRTETRIGHGPVSFGYATVELANNIFQSLEDCSILVLGAGETATAVSRSLVERGARRLKVANRGSRRAEAFHAEFPQAQIVPFDERLAAIAEADLVVAATSAPEAILGREALEASMRERRNRPLLMVDLGVPRDVDPAAGGLANLFLHDVDSLQELIGRTLAQRKEQIPAADRIVDQELERFEIWFGSLVAAPLVAQLHRQAERIRQQELEAHKATFPAHSHAQLDTLTRAIVRKILHHPSTRLRDSASENLGHLAALRELFQLDGESEEVAPADEAGPGDTSFDRPPADDESGE